MIKICRGLYGIIPERFSPVNSRSVKKGAFVWKKFVKNGIALFHMERKIPNFLCFSLAFHAEAWYNLQENHFENQVWGQ